MENSNDIIDEEKNVSSKKKLAIILTICVVLIIGVFSILFIPRIKLNGSKTVSIKLNGNYLESGAIATSGISNISKDIKIKGNVDTTKPGKYEVIYSIKRGFITQRVKRIVEVVDDVLPTIQLKGDINTFVCPNSEYKEEGYTALDNYDGDITSKVVIEKNDDSITYTVEDSSKNKATVKRTIEKKDIDKPKITILGNSTTYVLKNSKYTDKGAQAVDNCDGDISKNIVVTGQVNTSKNGTYKVKYEIKDSSGNISTSERKVIVYDKSSNVNTSGKKGVIYLTFDDGPSISITPGVLKILKEKNVKATFFVINHSNDLNYLIKQEYNDGHTVALHSYTHNYKTIYSSSSAYFNDLQKISDKVKSLIGVESKIIRFPGGTSNTVSRNYSKGIMTYLANEVLNRGYHYFDWNVSSGDAGGSNTKQQVYKSVVNGLSHNKANVVLMHDFENNYKTLNALSDIIDYGFSNGYSFEAIDMSTAMVTHKPNN